MPKDSNDSLSVLSALFIFMYAHVVTHQAPCCICSTSQYKHVPNHSDELSTCVCVHVSKLGSVHATHTVQLTKRRMFVCWPPNQ